jgi:hypothetical protein
MPGAIELRFTGRIWTIDSWDGETFTVEMKDQHGNVMDTTTRQGNNFARLADETLQCPNTVGGWDDGYFNVALTAPYDSTMGDVTIRLTNTLDQNPDDEAIGWGNLKLEFDYIGDLPEPEPVVEEEPEEVTSPADYDHGVEDPSGLWENNCDATKK